MPKFRWEDWNRDKCDKHNVAPSEAEEVVRSARPPYPQRHGDGKYIVRGQTEAGAYLQVIYVLDPDGTIFVIHARPLREKEKRVHRRRTR